MPVRPTTAHTKLLGAIAHNAHCLCEKPASINNGDLVAIEVEASNPRKTAPNNVTADLNAGVAIVIIATMPKTVEAATKALLRELPTDILPRVIVTDALLLLGELQEDKS